MKKRILLISFCITALALLLFSIVSTEVYYRSSLNATKEYLRAYMGAFQAERFEEEGYALALSQKLQNARVTFLTLDGEILADSHDENGGLRVDRPEVEQAMGEECEGFDVRASQTTKKTLVYYCKKFEGGLVRIAVPARSMWDIYLRALPAVAGFLVADAFVCLLCTYLASGFMLRPMEKLVKDASRQSEVQTDCPELKPIAKLINRRNADVVTHVARLQEEKERVVRTQQSKNDFIANITHEMNTPLTSIRGFAELLASGNLEGERAIKASNVILSQSERLTSLIASIINYNEIDSDDLPLYEVNASKIVRETLETLAPSFKEKNLTLNAQIDEEVLLSSRYERVTQIVGNLVRNAVRYNREEGSVTVLLTKEKFCVEDTGVGISQEDLGRIFERFYTVDKSHGGKNGGFGLGLSIVKKLCQKQGWQLTVQSKLNEGTTFTVIF